MMHEVHDYIELTYGEVSMLNDRERQITSENGYSFLGR